MGQGNPFRLTPSKQEHSAGPALARGAELGETKRTNPADVDLRLASLAGCHCAKLAADDGAASGARGHMPLLRRRHEVEVCERPQSAETLAVPAGRRERSAGEPARAACA